MTMILQILVVRAVNDQAMLCRLVCALADRQCDNRQNHSDTPGFTILLS